MTTQQKEMDEFTVNCWQEQVTIPTYPVGKPDRNPMFFEKRVYQGSSGVVYPNPVIEKVYDEKEEKLYQALFLENHYIKIMILPELGGRIQMAYDKIKQRHFIYYNQVIKPALVGLTGPWISGGIEFNWPQHHRPSTFEPVDYDVEEHADGSKTVWVSEVEKMFHTKGMAGFTLRPDKAYIEITARLFNRTELPQTFLWWANPAVKVNDAYQSVFPPDVNAVFDHGKRDVSTFPIATGTYYKVDYSPGTDISRYKNIPVPTSYMAIRSDYDFVGGYEHDTQAGLLHVANHHVSPGKKQWTWGNGDFGKAWDRNLTDEDGPYIELMTGVYTDNQPDFSWLMPNEEKSFTQYFMPYRELGIVKNANKDILLALEPAGSGLVVKVMVTGLLEQITVSLKAGERLLMEDVQSLSPQEVYVREIPGIFGIPENELLLTIVNRSGKELIRYEPAKIQENTIPEPAKPALAPEAVESTEQLFLTGQHLEQYRHATYSPVPYYEEALKRDAKDIRNNNALGLWYLRRGQFSKSEVYFRQAVATITERNPNPYDSEPYYNLGLSLQYQGKTTEAYEAFYKATWSNAWKDSGYFAVACIDMQRGDTVLALEHVELSLERNAVNGKALVLKLAILRKLGRLDDAVVAGRAAIGRDRFNLAAYAELSAAYLDAGQPAEAASFTETLQRLSRRDVHSLLEYAVDFSAAGLYEEAAGLLQYASTDPLNPMVAYYLGWLHDRLDDREKTEDFLRQASLADPFLCFPNRLQDIRILQFAIEKNIADARASYYLGNLFYDKRQYAEAIAYWETAAGLDGSFPTVFRNLGIAYYNKKSEPARALACYEKAFALDPSDARVLMELDQLSKLLNKTPAKRLDFLEEHLQTTLQRDDTCLERITLYNLLGREEEALQLLLGRQFHPWEGGEGKVAAQYVFSLIAQATKFLRGHQPETAIHLLTQALTYPHNLGEGKLFGTRENDIFYGMGCAYEQMGNHGEARRYFSMATEGSDEPAAAMFYNDQQPDKIFYQGMAYMKLGHHEKSSSIFKKLVDYGAAHLNDVIRIDYFAVSLPDLLIFDADLDKRNRIHCHFMMALGNLGLKIFYNAEEHLQTILREEPNHQGAIMHLQLLQELKSTTIF
ncbi:Tfp pilus assembly protein PilF [bacterium A37T11]|nr:Tfp pilus assembly protein PilF [bacterium A37T11]